MQREAVMVWLVPVLLITFGAWRFYALSRTGILEMWLGLFILVVCVVLSVCFLTGAITCAAFC